MTLTVVCRARGGFGASYACVTASAGNQRVNGELGRQGSRESIFLAEGREGRALELRVGGVVQE